MERRKLQSTGGASLTLTLPKAWTSRLNLQGKDEVLVKANGSTLTIRPANRTRQEITVELTVDNKPDQWIVREMIGAFISGSDRIILRSDRITPAQNHIVRQAVQLLFGFEILEESSQKMVVRSVLDNARFPVSESTLRIFGIVRSMFEDALLAVKTGDSDLALDVKQRDYEVNKFLHAIKRQFQEILSDKVEGDLNEVGFYRSVAIQLERVGDHAVKIAGLANTDHSTSIQMSSTFPTIQKAVHQLLEDVDQMVRHLDKVQAHKILDSDNDLERLFYSSKRMKHSYEGALIEDSLDRLRGYLMNIAELTIDYAIIRG